MSQSQNTKTTYSSSEEVIQTIGASVYVLNNNASDIIKVVHVKDFNEEDASSICTDSTVTESIKNSIELCKIGPRIIENLGDLRHVTYSNIHIENSTDILLGTKAIFNEPVIIQQVQQLVVNSDSRIVNQSELHGALPDSMDTNDTPEKQFCCCRWTYRTISIAISAFSLISSLAVAGYFLYVHITALHAGAIFVCKTNGTDTCYIGSSTFSCSNLISSDDRPFISGHTTAGFCKIYSRRGCLGDTQQIGTNHTMFDFDAMSATCYKKLFQSSRDNG